MTSSQTDLEECGLKGYSSTKANLKTEFLMAMGGRSVIKTYITGVVIRRGSGMGTAS